MVPLVDWIDSEYKTYEKVPIRRTFLMHVWEFLNRVQEPLLTPVASESEACSPPQWLQVHVPRIYFNQNIYSGADGWPDRKPLPSNAYRRCQYSGWQNLQTPVPSESNFRIKRDFDPMETPRDFVDIPCAHKTSMSKVTQSLPPNLESVFTPFFSRVGNYNFFKCLTLR